MLSITSIRLYVYFYFVFVFQSVYCMDKEKINEQDLTQPKNITILLQNTPCHSNGLDKNVFIKQIRERVNQAQKLLETGAPHQETLRLFLVITNEIEQSSHSDIRLDELLSVCQDTIASFYLSEGLDQEAISLYKKAYSNAPRNNKILYRLLGSYLSYFNKCRSILCSEQLLDDCIQSCNAAQKQKNYTREQQEVILVTKLTAYTIWACKLSETPGNRAENEAKLLQGLRYATIVIDKSKRDADFFTMPARIAALRITVALGLLQIFLSTDQKQTPIIISSIDKGSSYFDKAIKDIHVIEPILARLLEQETNKAQSKELFDQLRNISEKALNGRAIALFQKVITLHTAADVKPDYTTALELLNTLAKEPRQIEEKDIKQERARILVKYCQTQLANKMLTVEEEDTLLKNLSYAIEHGCELAKEQAFKVRGSYLICQADNKAQITQGVEDLKQITGKSATSPEHEQRLRTEITYTIVQGRCKLAVLLLQELERNKPVPPYVLDYVKILTESGEQHPNPQVQQLIQYTKGLILSFNQDQASLDEAYIILNKIYEQYPSTLLAKEISYVCHKLAQFAQANNLESLEIAYLEKALNYNDSKAAYLLFNKIKDKNDGDSLIKAEQLLAKLKDSSEVTADYIQTWTDNIAFAQAQYYAQQADNQELLLKALTYFSQGKNEPKEKFTMSAAQAYHSLAKLELAHKDNKAYRQACQYCAQAIELVSTDSHYVQTLITCLEHFIEFQQATAKNHTLKTSINDIDLLLLRYRKYITATALQSLNDKFTSTLYLYALELMKTIDSQPKTSAFFDQVENLCKRILASTNLELVADARYQYARLMMAYDKLPQALELLQDDTVKSHEKALSLKNTIKTILEQRHAEEQAQQAQEEHKRQELLQIQAAKQIEKAKKRQLTLALRAQAQAEEAKTVNYLAIPDAASVIITTTNPKPVQPSEIPEIEKTVPLVKIKKTRERAKRNQFTKALNPTVQTVSTPPAKDFIAFNNQYASIGYELAYDALSYPMQGATQQNQALFICGHNYLHGLYCLQNVDYGLTLLIQAGGQGNIQALFELGFAYLTPLNLPVAIVNNAQKYGLPHSVLYDSQESKDQYSQTPAYKKWYSDTQSLALKSQLQLLYSMTWSLYNQDKISIEHMQAIFNNQHHRTALLHGAAYCCFEYIEYIATQICPGLEITAQQAQQQCAQILIQIQNLII